jgi:hypothetical protein
VQLHHEAAEFLRELSTLKYFIGKRINGHISVNDVSFVRRKGRMSSLVRFSDFKAQGNTTPKPSQSPDVGLPPVIEQLRHRLVSGNCADSVDVRIAIVGELVYCCYLELLNRRYL